MKTTKVILVAMLMAFATMGFTQAESKSNEIPKPNTKSSIMPLSVAVQNQALKMAIYDQVKPQMVTKTIPIFVANIKFHHRVYYIGATYGDWMEFFKIRPIAIKKD